jgi:hypothetical protein
LLLFIVVAPLDMVLMAMMMRDGDAQKKGGKQYQR